MSAAAERRLGFLLNELSHLLRREFDRRVHDKGVGLTRAQWLILRQLSLRGDCLQRELAEALRVEPATVGRHVGRLVAGGWLDRHDDPHDGRAYRLRLRPKARRTLSQLKRLATHLRDEYLTGIPPARRERLIDDLLIIKGNLLACRARAAHPSFNHANHPESQAAG
jgi:DNA-binding MarR family transcriptional regulator